MGDCRQKSSPNPFLCSELQIQWGSRLSVGLLDTQEAMDAAYTVVSMVDAKKAPLRITPLLYYPRIIISLIQRILTLTLKTSPTQVLPNMPTIFLRSFARLQRNQIMGEFAFRQGLCGLAYALDYSQTKCSQSRIVFHLILCTCPVSTSHSIFWQCGATQFSPNFQAALTLSFWTNLMFGRHMAHWLHLQSLTFPLHLTVHREIQL
jgi:hypothetical protein